MALFPVPDINCRYILVPRRRYSVFNREPFTRDSRTLILAQNVLCDTPRFSRGIKGKSYMGNLRNSQKAMQTTRREVTER